VVKNTDTSLFEISIANVISDTSIILDGIRFAVQSDCVPDYV